MLRDVTIALIPSIIYFILFANHEAYMPKQPEKHISRKARKRVSSLETHPRWIINLSYRSTPNLHHGKGKPVYVGKKMAQCYQNVRKIVRNFLYNLIWNEYCRWTSSMPPKIYNELLQWVCIKVWSLVTRRGFVGLQFDLRCRPDLPKTTAFYLFKRTVSYASEIIHY